MEQIHDFSDNLPHIFQRFFSRYTEAAPTGWILTSTRICCFSIRNLISKFQWMGASTAPRSGLREHESSLRVLHLKICLLRLRTVMFVSATEDFSSDQRDYPLEAQTSPLLAHLPSWLFNDRLGKNFHLQSNTPHPLQ
jgi:hypothetical protein